MRSKYLTFSWVRAPAKEVLFFLKSDIKWAFYTFLIHVINLRGQDSLKTHKFVQEMSKIEIAIYI